MSRYTHDVLIVGGGLAGGTLAAALAAQDFRVAVVEQSTTPRRDPRVTALNRSSVRLYEAIGLWDGMASAAQPMNDIQVVDGPSGPSLHFLSSEDVEVGAHGDVVPNAVMQKAIADALGAATPVDEFRGVTAQPKAADDGAAQVTLTDGTQLSAPLLVAADGGRSHLRKEAGISAMTRAYGQANITATLDHGGDHGGAGFQRFLPPGPVAFIPMQGQQSSLAWTVSADAAQPLMALSDGDFLALLSDQIFGKDGADGRGPLTAVADRITYPIHAVVADRFHDDRMVLVGDAAHVIHPLAGQGFNLSLRDIAVLAQLLVEARSVGGDLGDARLCARYTSMRRPDIMATFLATDSLNRAFSNSNGALKTLRRAAIRFGRSQPRLQRLFSKQAQGALLGLPPLMSGS